jgi:hypothetical protein
LKSPRKIVNDKTLAANRKNARKSTGPKTPEGKATSSRNAVKHGVLAAPVLPGLESPEAWEDHLTDVVKSLAPVGYIENLLAERIALIAWRLQRVVRYEVEVTAASAATAEMDMEDQAENGKPQDPAESREEAGVALYMVEMLTALPKMPADEKLDSGAAAEALWAFWRELPMGTDRISIPGVPDDDAEFDRLLGTDKSRGYCLEMICADFLAGANVGNGDTSALLLSLDRLFKLLPPPQREQFLDGLQKAP